MKNLKLGRIVFYMLIIFGASLTFEACSSGPKTSNRHCVGKKNKKSKRVKGMTRGGMAR